MADEALLASQRVEPMRLAETGFVFRQPRLEQALRELVRLKRQEAVRRERGRLRWEGDLDRSRQAR